MASYENVAVLLMRWGAEDDGAWRSIDLFDSAFQRYNFKVTSYDITFNNALPNLLSALDDIDRETAREALLIIVYAGHGGIDIPGGLTMGLKGGNEFEDGNNCHCPAGRERRLSPQFSWIPVQNKINAMKRDVLTILECCNAAGAISGVSMSDVWGRKEIIAACGYKESTEIPQNNPRREQGRLTFSRALAMELDDKRFSIDAFSAAVLHRDVLRRILAWNVDLGHRGNMAETPVYICVGEPGIGLSMLTHESTVAIEPASRKMKGRAGSPHSGSDSHRQEDGESSGIAEAWTSGDDSTTIKEEPQPLSEASSEKSRKSLKISPSLRSRSNVFNRVVDKQVSQPSAKH